jgi:hypothetical protein
MQEEEGATVECFWYFYHVEDDSRTTRVVGYAACSFGWWLMAGADLF